MKKQERKFEVEVNGTPDLSRAPKDLLQLFYEAMLEEIEAVSAINKQKQQRGKYE